MIAAVEVDSGLNAGTILAEAAKTIGGIDKIFKVHFRNVDQPLPHFVETFVDDGYGDMSNIMGALAEVGFRGVLIPDHIPQMADDPRVGTAYTIAYMKALVEQATSEIAAA